MRRRGEGFYCWPLAGEKSEPDRRLDDQATRLAHVFTFETLPFPRVTVRNDGRRPVSRISGHTSLALMDAWIIVGGARRRNGLVFSIRER